MFVDQPGYTGSVKYGLLCHSRGLTSDLQVPRHHQEIAERMGQCVLFIVMLVGVMNSVLGMLCARYAVC